MGGPSVFIIPLITHLFIACELPLLSQPTPNPSTPRRKASAWSKWQEIPRTQLPIVEKKRPKIIHTICKNNTTRTKLVPIPLISWATTARTRWGATPLLASRKTKPRKTRQSPRSDRAKKEQSAWICHRRPPLKKLGRLMAPPPQKKALRAGTRYRAFSELTKEA